MNEKQIIRVVVILGLMLGGFIVSMLWITPHYRVWKAGLTGEAMLKVAEQEKKIIIETAKARLEASKLDAQAEVERAKGMSMSIAEVGEMAQKFPEYKNQRFIEAFSTAMEEGKIDHVIYVPTEANIPILEAGNR